MMLVKWVLDLKADPAELNLLFHKSLHGVTQLLNWMASSVKLMFKVDDEGIWAACWAEPCLSGAYVGAWIRKGKRQTRAALKFMNEAYEILLSKCQVLLGLTKQERLHNLHLKLGYKFMCTIPKFWDGDDVMLYAMTAESRAEVM